MKRSIVILLTIALSALLCSCTRLKEFPSSSITPYAESDSATSINENIQPIEATKPETGSAAAMPLQHPGTVSPIEEVTVVNVVVASPDVLCEYDSVTEFIEFDDENYQKIIFTTNRTVKDFKFLWLGDIESNESSAVGFVNGVLFTMDELSPEKPFVVTWMEWGRLLNRGISYVDDDGVTRYFSINLSGQGTDEVENPIVLSEFSLAPPPVITDEEPCTYEIRARIHEELPEYRFVASGVTRSTDYWFYGFILGLEVFDENGLTVLAEDFSYMNNGVVLGSHVYNNMMDTMGLHVTDVNFDGYKDLIILESFSGAHSNTTYYCWLWDTETSSFAASDSFQEICNPAIDRENECIYSAGGSGACYWGGSIYRYIDGVFVMTNDLYTNMYGLTETKLIDGKMETVREVFYIDKYSNSESIAEMEYYKNDEIWQLAHPRWYWYGGHHADMWLEGYTPISLLGVSEIDDDELLRIFIRDT